MIILTALAAAAGLAVLEWRRVQQRHRSARVAAVVLAVAALAAWGRQSGANANQSAQAATSAMLVTSGAPAGSSQRPDVPSGFRFARPHTGAPDDTSVIPDVAYLRRHHPQINRLHITGDGLEAFELDELRGLRVSFENTATRSTASSITWLSVPRRLLVGEKFEVRGRVEGPEHGKRVRMVLESPDGSTTDAVVTASSQEAAFAISAPAVAAEGRFLWTIKLLEDDERGSVVSQERVGAAVVAPSLPRLLFLESSPSVETTQLRRWFTEIGGMFAARTLIGNARYRFHGAEFATIDAQLLRRTDLVVADAAALRALATEESEALRAAVHEQGLGLLILRAEPTAAGSTEPLIPWNITSQGTDAESATRSARLQWRDATPLDFPVTVANVAAKSQATETSLISDSAGRGVVSVIQRGRGQIALSLVHDTWQWRMQDRTGSFAHYWSFLLSRLAKPDSGESWAVMNPVSASLLVDQPIELRYSGGTDSATAGQITREGDSARVLVPLAQDTTEPRNWTTTFWPRHSGWHRVVAPASGRHLDFFVHERNEWPSLGASRRRTATARFAALSDTIAAASATGDSRPGRGSAVVFFALFVSAAGYLWFEWRRAS